MQVPDEEARAAAVEPVASDLDEIYGEAEKLKDLLEAKIDAWTDAKRQGISGWAQKLATVRASLEGLLDGVDRRTDEVAGRFPKG